MATKIHPIRISDEEWLQFKKLCEKNGVDCSSKIRELIRSYLNLNEEEVQQSNNQDIYNLLDNIHNRMGEIHLTVIERNTQPIQREAVFEYCQKKGYNITNPIFESREYKGDLSLSYSDEGVAIFGKGR